MLDFLSFIFQQFYVKFFWESYKIFNISFNDLFQCSCRPTGLIGRIITDFKMDVPSNTMLNITNLNMQAKKENITKDVAQK